MNWPLWINEVVEELDEREKLKIRRIGRGGSSWESRGEERRTRRDSDVKYSGIAPHVRINGKCKSGDCRDLKRVALLPRPWELRFRISRTRAARGWKLQGLATSVSKGSSKMAIIVSHCCRRNLAPLLHSTSTWYSPKSRRYHSSSSSQAGPSFSSNSNSATAKSKSLTDDELKPLSRPLGVREKPAVRHQTKLERLKEVLTNDEAIAEQRKHLWVCAGTFGKFCRDQYLPS